MNLDHEPGTIGYEMISIIARVLWRSLKDDRGRIYYYEELSTYADWRRVWNAR